MNILICLLCISYAALAQSDYLGPPPGSAGTIDFRYPDAVVEPRPDCPYEGFFPHPRFCTWFYRCFSFYEGYLHREYFQCEPGTSFNPALRRCSWGIRKNCSMTVPVTPPYKNPCDSCTIQTDNCQDYSVCPDRVPVGLRLCKYAIEKCPQDCKIKTSGHICNDGMVYSPSNNKCYSGPDSPELRCTPDPPSDINCTMCFTQFDNNHCRVHRVCPERDPVELHLCTQASKVCPLCKSKPSVSICNDGMVYSPSNDKCYSDPDSLEMRCPKPTPAPPIDVDCTTCFTQFDNSHCRVHRVCPESVPVELHLCTKASKVCPLCNSRPSVSICEVGMVYSTSNNKCYPSPDDSRMQCPPPTSYPTPSPLTPPTPQPTPSRPSSTESTTTLDPCNDCFNLLDDCQVSRVCPESVPVDWRLCKSAKKVCPGCKSNPSEPICGAGMVYSPSSNKCYLGPNDPRIWCEPPPTNPPTKYPSPSTTEVTSTISSTSLSITQRPTPPVPSCEDCLVNYSGCGTYAVCPSGTPILMHLCSQAIDVCCGVKCDPGLFYSTEQATCFPSPDSTAMACPAIPSVTIPSISKPPPTISVTTPKQDLCSRNNAIPDADWIRERHCELIAICPRNTNTRIVVSLCKQYFECIANLFGFLDLVTKQCPVNMLFSYNQKKCVDEPRPDERC